MCERDKRSEKGNDMKKNAMHWRNKARNVVDQGGNFDKK